MTQFENFLSEVKARFDDHAYVAITCTDHFAFIPFDELLDGKVDERYILEVRVFDENGEYRLSRDYIGSPFREVIKVEDKILCDQVNPDYGMALDSYEDFQFMDIDMARTVKESGKIKATGGGEYRFPYPYGENTRVKIKNYIAYDDNGQAVVVAWRLAGVEA